MAFKNYAMLNKTQLINHKTEHFSVSASYSFILK